MKNPTRYPNVQTRSEIRKFCQNLLHTEIEKPEISEDLKQNLGFPGFPFFYEM